MDAFGRRTFDGLGAATAGTLLRGGCDSSLRDLLQRLEVS